MLHEIVFNDVTGYVNIQIEGYFVERFVNICISKHILLWNIKRSKSNLVYANISIKDFKRLPEIAKKTKCRIQIKKKKGLPFVLHRYKKRKLFLVFLLFLIGGIFLLSNFVWNIEITGNQNIATDELLATVKQEGLTTGMWKQQINTKEIINKMRLERDDLAWVGIEIKGTNAIIKVVEADQKPDIINEEEYCNIVATKPGIIVKVNAINGTPLVKEGDVIQKGSILVGGWLEGKYTGMRYVHANGEVQAKVWYSDTQEMSLQQTKKVPTQNEENKYSVKINNFQINLYKTLSKFQKYDTIVENEKIKLFSDFYLPIEIIKTTNQEYQEQEVTYTMEEAKQMAVEKAKKNLEEQIKGKEIINTYINYKEEEQKVEAQVIYEVLEEIGTKEKIVF